MIISAPPLLRSSAASILVLILLCAGIAFAGEPDVRFESANQIYRSGNYEKAAKLYEEILSQGYEGPALYYNLGNCYYKMNNIPAAILQFERARKLDPDDEDINHNLALANLRVVDRIDPIPDLFYMNWWRKWSNLTSSNVWAGLAVGFLWLALLLFAALFLPYRSYLMRRILSSLALILLALFVISVAAAVDRHGREQEQDYAIVFSASTDARSAPDPQSTSLFVLHEGVKVQLLDHVGDWNKIRLADGKIGWIPATALKAI